MSIGHIMYITPIARQAIIAQNLEPAQSAETAGEALQQVAAHARTMAASACGYSYIYFFFNLATLAFKYSASFLSVQNT